MPQESLLTPIPTVSLLTYDSNKQLSYGRETVRLWYAVPTSEKFIVQLSAVVTRQAGPAQNMFISRSRRFWRGRSLWARISDGRGRSPPTTVGVRKLEWLPFRVVSNIRSASFSFVTIHASDRRTNRRTEFRQQYRALHYMQSPGKNGKFSETSLRHHIERSSGIYKSCVLLKLKKTL